MLVGLNIACESGAANFLDYMHKQFSWTLHRSLPRRFEDAIFSARGPRTRREGVVGYTARKVALLQQLERAGCALPDSAKGLCILRDALLPRQASDALHVWLKGEYGVEAVCDRLRRLERPGPSGQSTSVVLRDREPGWEETDETYDIEQLHDQDWGSGSICEPGTSLEWLNDDDCTLEEEQAQLLLAQMQ